MEWIKFSKKEPEEKVIVLVKFNNGKEIKGHSEGNFMVYNPKEINFKDLISKAKEWSYIEKHV